MFGSNDLDRCFILSKSTLRFVIFHEVLLTICHNLQLNIFYVDRLTDDKANKIDVHANAIIFINSLLKALDDEYIISDYEIYNFNERFNDVCAGAYVSCRIQMPLSECYDSPK